MSVGRARSDSDALGGVINGYAPLDSGLRIPSAYMRGGKYNLSPDADSWIGQDGATTNNSSDTQLYIADRISSPGGFTKTALLSFTLSSLSGNVVRADLWLKQEGTGNGAIFTGHLGVRKVLRTVVMSQVTYNVYSTGNSWSTAGCRGTGDCTQWFDTATLWSSPVNSQAQWVSFDATQVIRRAIEDGDTSIVLQVASIDVTTGSQNPLQFASKDSATPANRPILSVVTV